MIPRIIPDRSLGGNISEAKLKLIMMEKRMHFGRLLVIGTLLLVPNAWAKAWIKSSAFKPDHIEVYKEVDGSSLGLHIFYPQSKKPDKPTPAIVMFHGGGFSKGSPGAFYYFCDYLASRGIVLR